MILEEALSRIEQKLASARAEYAATVEPGVSDNSVLEAEIETLENVLTTLKEVDETCLACGHCNCGECSIRGEGY